MKRAKHSVAVVIRGPDGTFLVVKRPDDPDDVLAGVWGFPAITPKPGEDDQAAVVRAGLVKLGVRLAVTTRVGEQTADRGGYLLHLSEYEAAIVSGTPSAPQADTSMTQYVNAHFTDDPAELFPAARAGSLCAQIFLTSTGTEPEPGRLDTRTAFAWTRWKSSSQTSLT
jgi:8-oxo-dGTP pyrophosphatase MutT (NUDIX family)